MPKDIKNTCQITGHRCGSDAWPTRPCPCRFCQEWVVKELSRLRQTLEDILEMAENDIKRDSFGDVIQGTNLLQIEADARAAITSTE
jgi:hypothetical protein